MVPLLGKPILVHTLDRFLDFDSEMKICVVLHPSLLAEWPGLVQDHFSLEQAARLSACEGGADRSESVHNGLKSLDALGVAPKALVAIHDGVRPIITSNFLNRGFQIAHQKGNATAAVPVKSSLREATDHGSKAVDRSRFFHVQTPQIFSLGEIMRIYAERPEGPFTDDASLAEAKGIAIHLFEGSYDNLKITTPEDLAIATQLLEGS